MKIVILGIISAVFIAGCGGGGGDATAASGVGLADLTGTWDYMGSGTVVDIANNDTLCGNSFKGVLTIDTDGEFNLSEVVHDSCKGDSSNLRAGTSNIFSNGTGTFTLPNQTIPFQLSRDKNTIIFAHIDTPAVYTSGIAYRR